MCIKIVLIKTFYEEVIAVAKLVRATVKGTAHTVPTPTPAPASPHSCRVAAASLAPRPVIATL